MELTLKENAVVIYDPNSGRECTMRPRRFRRKILAGDKIIMSMFPPSFVQIPYEEAREVIELIEERLL